MTIHNKKNNSGRRGMHEFCASQAGSMWPFMVSWRRKCSPGGHRPTVNKNQRPVPRRLHTAQRKRPAGIPAAGEQFPICSTASSGRHNSSGTRASSESRGREGEHGNRRNSTRLRNNRPADVAKKPEFNRRVCAICKTGRNGRIHDTQQRRIDV